MSDKSFLENQIEILEQTRDELQVQAHLFQSDVKDEWGKLDQRLRDARGDLTKAAEESVEDIGDATKNLLEELKNGFDRIRKAL